MTLHEKEQLKTDREKKNNWNIKKHILISSAILTTTVTFFKFAGDLIGNRFYKLAIARNDKTRLTRALNSDIEKMEIPQYIKERLEEWETIKEKFIQQYPPESVFYHADDTLRLHAYRFVVHSDSHRWAVLLHGYSGNASSMFFYAAMFARHGFNVLVPDLRGAGKSEGDYIGMGWDDRLDVVGWINKIVGSDPEAKVVIHGVSMGGATAMMTTGEELPENVVAVVEDCGYSSVAEEFTYELRNLYRLPSFPLLQLANRAIKERAGYSIYDASAVKQLKKAKVPVLFIHGGADTYVPTEMVYKVYEAAASEKELLVVENAPHGASSVVDPDLYFSTMFRFIGKYLKDECVPFQQA
ncbi:alpha/beta fold hydrolase [Bacillaceae bacterium Marseille-Q3522]|nr:alpha/beta fold hydrolase [Bacillaceae bacterium Marseille-Q3522]